MTDKGWQEGQDPEKYSRWLLDDGRTVSVIGVDWLLNMSKPIALSIDTPARRSGPRVVYMSKAGFWKRVERQL